MTQAKENNRPKFPKRAVITGGMPYGNKELHFGHIGGVFVHADAFARFLRDRIGEENVIFISGTDCYGSPISEHYRQLVEKGEIDCSIEEFVEHNHKLQKEALDKYLISLNLFSASGLGRAKEIHRQVSEEVFNCLYENGYLVKSTTSQFYDPELEVFLNGRQVEGQCPIEGCQSEKGYADECSLGHQYMPADLINPRSRLSGKKPILKDVTNWYFKLEEFQPLLQEWVDYLKTLPNTRPMLTNILEEFLKPPVIYVKKEFEEQVEALKGRMPKFTLVEEEKKTSFEMVFESLEDREQACEILSENEIQYRTGKTLVPFRLTGNVEWGVPAPEKDGVKGLTFWVWPESLWAPISFTKTYLEMQGRDPEEWKDWWCSQDAQVFQFIGEDNIYFYGLAEMAMFMAFQGENPAIHPDEGQVQLPTLIANCHILFLDKKASSSGKVKPPMARDLLDYYTPEQLRAHFLGLGLGIRSVSFQPKPLNPKAKESEGDPALKEGNLLTNVLNRLARSCFYTTQKYFDGKMPVGQVSEEVLKESEDTILEYEQLMYKFEFHNVMNLLDSYIRNANKYWSAGMKEVKDTGNEELRRQIVIDGFHMLRTSIVLMHPIAPEGTEMVCEYLGFGKEFWDWNRIFDTVYDFMEDPQNHKMKYLEPRMDFFRKHPSQLK
ncbi:MAG: class I tRNA ligase family protein [Clostridiales bacterium]|jgi:methionyl-tRNA synthetase|nr:class I tRNA ligase family protein [Clostridiales bacterium]